MKTFLAGFILVWRRRDKNQTTKTKIKSTKRRHTITVILLHTISRWIFSVSCWKFTYRLIQRWRIGQRNLESAIFNIERVTVRQKKSDWQSIHSIILSTSNQRQRQINVNVKSTKKVEVEYNHVIYHMTTHVAVILRIWSWHSIIITTIIEFTLKWYLFYTFLMVTRWNIQFESRWRQR